MESLMGEESVFALELEWVQTTAYVLAPMSAMMMD